MTWLMRLLATERPARPFPFYDEDDCGAEAPATGDELMARRSGERPRRRRERASDAFYVLIAVFAVLLVLYVAAQFAAPT